MNLTTVNIDLGAPTVVLTLCIVLDPYAWCIVSCRDF